MQSTFLRGHKRLLPLLISAALLVVALLTATQALSRVVQAAPAAQPPVTTITVDTTADLESDSVRNTCGYTLGGGALFQGRARWPLYAAPRADRSLGSAQRGSAHPHRIQHPDDGHRLPNRHADHDRHGRDVGHKRHHGHAVRERHAAAGGGRSAARPEPRKYA